MLKIDFHVHTHYSKCAINSPREIIKWAVKKGLNGIALTDHNTAKGYFKAKKIKTNLKIIPGVEINTNHGDIIALGITPNITNGKSPDEIIDLIKDLGGVSLIPHPFDFVRKGVGFILDKLKPDLIEVYNSNMMTPFGNYLAYKYALKLNCGITAGSDAHSTGELASAYSFVEDGTIDDIISFITKNRSKFYGKPVPLNWLFLRKIRVRFR